MKYIVVDLEMNNICKKSEAFKNCKMETIEIGAIMLNEDYLEISAFKTYVKPEYNSHILSNISALTGITDSTVLNAPKFNEALKMFTEWCLKTGDEINLYAWSKNDYEQICREKELKNYISCIEEGKILECEWCDFQNEFDIHLGFEKQISLKTALDMAGIEFEGREHDALYDARNTAKLLQLFKDKKLFDLTLRKIKEAMAPTPFGTSLGSLFDFSNLATA